MRTEILRQTLHVFLVAPAFLLRDVPSWQVAIVLGVGAIAVLFFIPHTPVKPFLYRQAEYSQRVSLGAFFYFALMAGIVACFPAWLAATTWAIFSVGDGIATIIGSVFSGWLLPWNERKTVAGTVAFFLVGWSAGSVLYLWVLGTQLTPGVAAGLALAAAGAAFTESLPSRLNDNITVPIITTLILALLGFVGILGGA